MKLVGCGLSVLARTHAIERAPRDQITPPRNLDKAFLTSFAAFPKTSQRGKTDPRPSLEGRSLAPLPSLSLSLSRERLLLLFVPGSLSSSAIVIANSEAGSLLSANTAFGARVAPRSKRKRPSKTGT